MTPAAGALLSLLGSGVNLLGRAMSPKTPVEGASFQELLERVKAGTLREGEPIRMGVGADVELTPDQLERLGEAAAELEKSGARRAVILLDGRAIEYDIEQRAVIREIDPADTAALAGIDAFVRAPHEVGSGVITTPSFAQSTSASLLRALGGTDAA